MPPKQIPILFEDDDTQKNRKQVSKDITMQSEEDWTPQALPKEAKPAAEPAAESDTAKPKAKRATASRARKPRASKAKADEAPAEIPAAPAPVAEAAPEVKKERSVRRGPRKTAAKSEEASPAEHAGEKRAEAAPQSPAPEPAKAAAASPEPREEREDRKGHDREESRHEQDRDRQARERENQREQGEQGQQGQRDQDQQGQREQGHREQRDRESSRDRDNQEQDRRPRHEQQHGGGNRRDREDRFQHRHGGGGGGGGNDRRDRQADNFRNKKKKKKGGGGGQRFDRPGGGGPPPFQAGGGGGGGPVSRRPANLPDPARFQDLEELEHLAAEATGEPLDLARLYEISLHDLVTAAREMGVVLDAAPNRRLLVSRMLEKAFEDNRPIHDRGILDVTEGGYGFITRHANNYRTQPEDTFVAESFIRRFGLQKGHFVEVQVRPPEDGERCPSVLRVNEVMGLEPEKVADIVPFEDLIPYYPLQRMLLEIPKDEPTKDVSMRAIDLLTPIGFGQRGLIVAPPRTGKTVILQQIANSIATNNPQSHLIVLLIDERPEEVTDFRRNVKGEVVSSTFDEPASSHVEVAEMVIEKARRMVEAGRHVIILLDSITRLARAYNAMMPNSGKILSGGVEANALQKPKRFFGAARNIEGGGSLTILATALIDTGSRMDEVIFEEFKGTGNMEIHLDRALVDKRIFPALNIERSGTRKEELLYHPEELNRIYSLRRAIQGVPMVEAMEMLVQRLKKTGSNAEFLMGMNR